MAEKKQVTVEKNPLGAAILSTICPGVGFFYIGNFMKGIAYMLILTSLIVLATKADEPGIVIFILMAVGFYIFQIFDSFNEAKKTRFRELPEEVNGEESISLTASIIILVMGIFFQLAELDVVRYRDISRLWPIVLIAVGAKFIYTYAAEQKVEKPGGKNE